MSQIRYKRATAQRWVELNPILGAGEPAYEIGTGRHKLGDGETHWNDLAYVSIGKQGGITEEQFVTHVNSESPHPAYDDGPSFQLLYENAKV